MALHRNVGRVERAASVVGGLALIAWTAKRPRSPLSRLARPFGAGLIARGLGGYCPVNDALGRTRARDDTRRALGGPRGTRVVESIIIDRPAAEVFPWWSNPARAMRFMRDVENVEILDNVRSRWTVRGPAGVSLVFDSEIINVIDNELVAWRTLPGADVASAGSVRLRKRGRASTAVTVTLQYDPPLGRAGAIAAGIVGHSPAVRLREDLRQLKTLLESDDAPDVHHEAGRRRATVDA